MIRVARKADAAELREIYRPSIEDSATSFELKLPSTAEMARRIAETLKTHPWLVIEGPRKRIQAYAYACPHRTRAAYQWCCEVSVYVAPKARRQGHGRTLYSALFAALLQQGYYNAYAGIVLPNPASVALHESLGFRHVGTYENIGFKLKRWHPVGWWHLALRTPDPPIGSPIPFPKLDKSQLAGILSP